MPTDQPCTTTVALFLFAHQDDEFGVFQAILDEVVAGRQVCCAYLTQEPVHGDGLRHRNSESLAVLNQMGVEASNVFFAGDVLSIADGSLPTQLAQAAHWISTWLRRYPDIRRIYVPAWEGGHHDHDALHAVVVGVAQRHGLLGFVRQFPLYNRYRCGGPWFRVLFVLTSNGVPEFTMISWKNRLRFLGYCLSYPSQRKTWLGLFPFVAWHYLFSGMQSLQRVSVHRIQCKPHEGQLYYERRNFFRWRTMVILLGQWEASH